MMSTSSLSTASWLLYTALRMLRMFSGDLAVRGSGDLEGKRIAPKAETLGLSPAALRLHPRAASQSKQWRMGESGGGGGAPNAHAPVAVKEPLG